MKSAARIFAFLLIVTASGWFFRFSAETSREVHSAIEDRLIEHPEFIPQARELRIVSSGFDNLIADYFWLSAIQYVGENAVTAEYKRYLYEMLALVTDLNPAFTTPYEVGLLLLPDMNPRYETFTKEEQEKNVLKAVWLGEKGMELSCDKEKIRGILAEPELSNVWKDPQYENPCANSMVPYYLAYVEYYNRKNAAKASEYYRIAAANKDAPTGARIMSAIMQGKAGDRAKSILMFLSIAESLETEEESAEACRTVAREMREVLAPAFENDNQGQIPSQFVKAADEFRIAAVGKMDEKTEEGNAHGSCSTYLGKALRELNLEFLVRKDRDFVATTGKQVVDAKDLYDQGGTDYLPRDFQKFEEGYEVIYVKDDGIWDYVTGSY